MVELELGAYGIRERLSDCLTTLPQSVHQSVTSD